MPDYVISASLLSTSNFSFSARTFRSVRADAVTIVCRLLVEHLRNPATEMTMRYALIMMPEGTKKEPRRNLK